MKPIIRNACLSQIDGDAYFAETDRRVRAEMRERLRRLMARQHRQAFASPSPRHPDNGNCQQARRLATA